MLRPGVPESEEMDDDNMQWRIAERHYFMQNNAHVTCAAFHAVSNILVAGFSNGIFGIYELPDFNTIQNLRYVRLKFGISVWLISEASPKMISILSLSTRQANGLLLEPRSLVNCSSGNGNQSPTS